MFITYGNLKKTLDLGDIVNKEKIKYGIYAIFIMIVLLISVGLILSINDLLSKFYATLAWVIMFFNTIALMVWAKGMNRINKENLEKG